MKKNDQRLPKTKEEWLSVFNEEKLNTYLSNTYRSANNSTTTVNFQMNSILSDPVKESLIAGALLHIVNKMPQQFTSLIRSSQLTSYSDFSHFIDPLEGFDPITQQGVLSPIGIIQLYRQYFFELDSFLGPSIGHVWIGPGSTVEIYEVHTRKTSQEREIEIMLNTTKKSETSTTDQDDIADAVKKENQQDTKLGITVSAGVNSGVYHADASATYNKNELQKKSEETTHKHMRQQTEKAL